VWEAFDWGEPIAIPEHAFQNDMLHFQAFDFGLDVQCQHASFAHEV
jgi:hypothetical protein